MSPRRTWQDGRVGLLLAELDKHGLSMSRDHAAEAIRGRVVAVAAQLGVTEKTARTYLTDDVVHDIAHKLAASFAHEAPGQNPLELGATHTVPTSLVGRTVAGLAIVAQLIVTDEPTGTNKLAFNVRQTTALISDWGISLERTSDQAAVYVHESLIHRTIREFEKGIARLDDDTDRHLDSDPVPLREALEDNVMQLRKELS
ncbi:hypothetical protein ABIA39_009080 [Nocardia sp. GAS34]|uniref:hypothetical protein n=1 Tax=unclassified Nocardia TaxID=2637762 RepID=UPI003D1C6A70